MIGISTTPSERSPKSWSAFAIEFSEDKAVAHDQIHFAVPEMDKQRARARFRLLQTANKFAIDWIGRPAKNVEWPQ